MSFDCYSVIKLFTVSSSSKIPPDILNAIQYIFYLLLKNLGFFDG